MLRLFIASVSVRGAIAVALRGFLLTLALRLRRVVAAGILVVILPKVLVFGVGVLKAVVDGVVGIMRLASFAIPKASRLAEAWASLTETE